MSNADRRQEPRTRLNLIVRIGATDPSGATSWAEVTTTVDASADGFSLLADHRLAVGQLVRVQVLPPLPKSLGPVRLDGPSPEIWGIVRSVRNVAGAYQAGVMFLERPPGGVPPAPPTERRHAERVALRMSFIVQKVDEMGVVLKECLGVTEDISQGGAQLASVVAFSTGDVVVLHETSGAFEGRAEIAHSWVDHDGILRLHVKFLDGRSPEPVALARR